MDPDGEWIEAEELAELCDQELEWVEARRFLLPCEVRLRDGRMRVAQSDLPLWLEAAKGRREMRRDPWDEGSLALLEDLQRKWGYP